MGRDGILVFKNYFENGELAKQEIFDNKGNIDYISNRNGKWIKSWEKIFAIAELHYANVIVEIKGRSYYKYYNYGVYETRSEPAERKEVKRNVEEIKSLNYGNHSKLLLIAKENYFTYINNGTYYVWYEIP